MQTIGLCRSDNDYRKVYLHNKHRLSVFIVANMGRNVKPKKFEKVEKKC